MAGEGGGGGRAGEGERVAKLNATELANLNGELAKQGLSSVAAAPVAVPECK